MIRQRQRRFDIATVIAMLIAALIMTATSYFFLAYTEEIARATKDPEQLIGQLGIFAGIGSFVMYLLIPFFIAAIRD